jgi:prophage DNA circulation protein
MIGRMDLEDGLKKLDKLTDEEIAMASAQLLKVTHKIDSKLTEVVDGVSGVDRNVQVVRDSVNAVYNMVQTIADGRKIVFSCHKRHL